MTKHGNTERLRSTRARPDRPRAKAKPHVGRAGFTLVELMVSTVIAGLIIGAMYVIGASTVQNMYEQQRISDTQLAVRVAMNRVREDIQRAGFGATTGDTAATRFCDGTAPDVRPVTVQNNAQAAVFSDIQANSSNTWSEADQLDLIGNQDTSELYRVRGADGARVALQTASEAFKRSFTLPDSTNPLASVPDEPRFTAVFATNVGIHIHATDGCHYIRRVASSSFADAEHAIVNVTPPLPSNSGGLNGASLSPLRQVRYRMVSGSPEIVDSNPSVAAIQGARTSLVRQMINMADGTVLSQATVLEFAVLFDIDAIMVDGATPPAFVTPADADVGASIQANPANLRLLRVSLAARTPREDTGFPWAAGGPPFTRYKVFNGTPGSARVRFLRQEIAVPRLMHQ